MYSIQVHTVHICTVYRHIMYIYEIKPSRRGEKMEILLKSDSSINESTKNIEVSEVEFKDDTPEEIELAGLQLKHVYL